MKNGPSLPLINKNALAAAAAWRIVRAAASFRIPEGDSYMTGRTAGTAEAVPGAAMPVSYTHLFFFISMT